jgi:hypothetical protein
MRRHQPGRFTRTSLFVISNSVATAASMRCASLQKSGSKVNDDTGMVCGSVLMKAEKVAAIVAYENAALCHNEGQNLVIRHSGISLTGIPRCHDVMPSLRSSATTGAGMFSFV